MFSAALTNLITELASKDARVNPQSFGVKRRSPPEIAAIRNPSR
ncbi:hypothetical protein [Laspinema olomoucense]|nr:hypothetical protein [Laspinema sp. D3b]